MPLFNHDLYRTKLQLKSMGIFPENEFKISVKKHIHNVYETNEYMYSIYK